MSFRNGVLAICSLAIICAAGCRSARGISSHQPPSDVVIFVDVSPSGDITVTPDTAYVDSPAQNVLWYSCAPDIDIVFTGGTLPSPRCEKGKGRCAMNVPTGKNGKHTYTVVASPASGEAKMVDPVIIVDY